MPTFSAEQLQAEAERIFVALGASQDDASWVAQLLVRANLCGHDSHGIIRIPQYFQACRRDQIRPEARPGIEKEGHTTARINGHRAFGQVTGRLVAEVAVAKASANGIGAVGAFDCNHVGRLADYVEWAANRGMVAFAFANDCGANQVVAPFGGLEGRLSTNPLAIAVPARPFPLCLDIATSMVALGKVAVRRNQGHPLPIGWVQDADGNPSTDPNSLDSSPPGTLLPMAGYKGYGLAVMVEILAGILTGAGFSQEELGPDLQGFFLLAFQMSDFAEKEAFFSQVGYLGRYLKSSRRQNPFGEIMVPGEQEWRTAEERMRGGIRIDPATWGQVQKVKEELGLA